MDEFRKIFSEWEKRPERMQELRELDKPRPYGGQVRFPRFSGYELVEGRHFRIIPTENARIEWYRPFEYEPDILRDYLNVVSEIKKVNDIKAFPRQFVRDAPKIIDFCIKYGFLTGPNEEDLLNEYGVIDFIRERDIEYWAERVKVTPKQFTKVFEKDFEAIKSSFDTWVLQAFRGLWKKKDIETITENPATSWPPSPEDRLKLAHGDSIHSWYIEALCDYFNLWRSFVEGGFHPTDPYTESRPEGPGHTRLEALMAAARRVRFVVPASVRTGQIRAKTWAEVLTFPELETKVYLSLVDGRWRIDYKPTTLADALQIMLMNLIAGAKEQIRYCALEECGRAFTTTDPRAHYCCPLHSQRGRIRKYRAARKQSETEKPSRKSSRTRRKSGKA